MISKDGSIPLIILYYYKYKLVEQLIRNAGVGCSSHPCGTTFLPPTSSRDEFYRVFHIY